jgi:hypothetical protein
MKGVLIAAAALAGIGAAAWGWKRHTSRQAPTAPAPATKATPPSSATQQGPARAAVGELLVKLKEPAPPPGKAQLGQSIAPAPVYVARPEHVLVKGGPNSPPFVPVVLKEEA